MKIGLLDSKTHYVLALSGGCDSVFLFHMLLRYNHNNFSCVYVHHHVNHHDDVEEEFCRTLCNIYNIHLDILDVTLDVLNKGFENTAREARYTAISKIIGESVLLLGHHIDDTIETVLQNIFRGTGINGLCGIKEKTFNFGMHIYRPLVNYVNKNQIRKYMHTHDLAYVEDESNTQLFTKRNVVRNIVIPLLTSHYVDIDKAILHLVQKANESVVLHENLAQIDACNSQVTYYGNHIRFYHYYIRSCGIIRFKNLFYYIFNGRNQPKLKSVTVDNIIKTVDKHIDDVGKKIVIDNVTIEIIENSYFNVYFAGE